MVNFHLTNLNHALAPCDTRLRRSPQSWTGRLSSSARACTLFVAKETKCF